jgi:FAD/FMN-containing dehydrogenase
MAFRYANLTPPLACRRLIGGEMSESGVQSRNPLLSDLQGFDRRWYAPNVQLVYTPATAQELAAALAEAEARYGAAGAVKVVSGRHCYERFVYDVTTRVIVDVSLLRGIGHNPGDGFWIESGNNNWNAYVALLNGFGVTLPAGSCYSVGAGGHICGGGYGVLSRLLGLTVDWLTAVDIACRRGPSDFQVKAYWDSGNFFQHPQSIPPRA